MSKYRVVLESDDISQPDIIVKVNSIAVACARKTAEIFNKGYHARKAIRMGGESSELKRLEELKGEIIESANGGDNVTEMILRGKFQIRVDAIRKGLNVVAWGVCKKEIPELPEVVVY